tara:strand:- start:560 stop:877 length:318 start_codon:yes stop_codon:yes gene_type:complete
MSIDNADKTFRNSFKYFKEEMSNKSINCELNVITESKIKSSIHDRFLITKYASYNIPSPDIIARGQFSEISKSENAGQLKKEFEYLWKNSKDIIKKWNDITNKLD